MSNRKITDAALENKPIKKAWRIGDKTVIVIDETLVTKLDVNLEHLVFEQVLVKDGVLLRVVRT